MPFSLWCNFNFFLLFNSFFTFLSTSNVQWISFFFFFSVLKRFNIICRFFCQYLLRIRSLYGSRIRLRRIYSFSLRMLCSMGFPKISGSEDRIAGEFNNFSHPRSPSTKGINLFHHFVLGIKF